MRDRKRSRLILEILLIVLGAIIAYAIFTFFYQRKIVTVLTEEQFREGYRKAQLIDVREPNEFDGGHILGARNIPLSQMKQRLTEIRPDKPVYLYCQNTVRSGRAAQLLRRKGYKDLYQLQGGFKKWSGKIKKK
ncbi:MULTISPECIES: rhodanese-like domain-containing protein [unclassified Fredinandcohnia]|uniref:rhodanese-like domain-containing protein n=1 Tax=unclassified Fredinandcohnia TaxID=2837514 RepID=UPI000EB03504